MKNKKQQPVDVILSVYNALDYLKLCVKSVLEKDAGYPFNLIIIDDKSPDENVRPYLESINDPRVTVIFNEVNLGYSGTNNKGIEYSENDILLLNSDTEVTEGWLKKIRDCAYLDEKTGSVSPFTNSGAGLLNVPDFYHKSNPIPDGYTLDSWASTFDEISIYSYPKSLTNVGYCMYIKREVIKKVGLLDKGTYGRGYGEDNDYSMRILDNGYANVNDDSTFILHEGGKSFATMNEEYTRDDLVKQGDQIIEQKYPEIRKWLDELLIKGPTTPMHQNWWFHQDFFSSNKRIMHVVRDSVDKAKGGIEQFVKQIAKGIDNFDHYVVHFSESKIEIMRLWDKNNKRKFLYVKNKFKENRYKLEDKQFAANFAKILDLINPSFVHFHSILGYPLNILEVPPAKNIPSALHVHDFSLFYPSYWDLKLKQEIEDEVLSLVKTSSKDTEYYKSRFNLLKNYLNKLSFVITPSDFVKSKIENFVNQKVEVKLIPNGIDLKKSKSQKINSDKKLRIAWVGNMHSFKGANEFINLIEKDSKNQFEWTVFGDAIQFAEKLDSLTKSRKLKLNGAFEHDNLGEIMQDIDIVVLPFNCAETFSFITFESLIANKYVITSDFGNPGHYLNKNAIGAVFEIEGFSENAWKKLNEIDKDRNILKRNSEKTDKLKIVGTEEANNLIRAEYENYAIEKRKFDVDYKKKLNELRVDSILFTNRIRERLGYSKKRKLFLKIIDVISDSTRKTPIHKPLKNIFSKVRKYI